MRRLNKRHILLLCLIIHFSNWMLAQNNSPLVSINANNECLSKILTQLSNKYNYKFAYDASRIDSIYISTTAENKTIADFLNMVLPELGLNSKLINDTYVIFFDDSNKKIINKDTPFKGIVIDRTSGEALPYSTIIFNDSLGTITNQLGLFSFNINQLPVSLKVSYMGYSKIDTIISTFHPQQIHYFYLKKSSESIKTIAVRGEDISIVKNGDQPGDIVYNPHLSNYLPHMGEPDLLQGISIIPGVNNTGITGGFSIRGSMPYSNLITLDGLPIFNISHYLGGISTVNPKYIKNITLSRGGFGANYGGSIAGIVDITGKSGNRNKPSLDLSINLLSLNLLTEIPISPKVTFLFAGRRSYTELVKTYLFDELFKFSRSQKNSDLNELEHEISPNFNFQDYHTKLTYNPSANEQISLSAYASKDKLGYSINENTSEYDFNYGNSEDWINKGLSVNWDRQHSSMLFSKLNIGISSYNNSRTIGNYYHDKTIDNEYNYQSKIRVENEVMCLQFNIDNILKINNQDNFNFGVNIRQNIISTSYYDRVTNNSDYNYNSEDDGTTISLYGKYQLNLTKALSLVPGLRTTYFSLNQLIYWEPRLAITSNIAPHLKLHGEIGKYYQFLSNMTQYDELGNNLNYWTFGHDGENPAQSFHLQGGIDYSINNLLIKLDIYLRKSEGIAVSYFIPGQDNAGNSIGLSTYSGSQKSNGIDLLLKKSFSKFTPIISCSYGRTLNHFQEINNNNYYPANNDNPLQIKLSGIYKSNQWRFSYLWSYTSGTPFTDFTYSSNVYNSLRLPNQHQLDIAAVKSFQYKKLSGDFGLTINNLYNRRNLLQKKFLYATEADPYNNEVYTTNIVANGILPVAFINIKL